jgi:hypothetical protein
MRGPAQEPAGGDHAVDPIREGSECGAAAPVRLISIGRSIQVALSPPPTVTCDMVAALHRWMERDVQPLAKKHLGAPVIRIETMSSDSCRNAYGRAGSRLSEHAKANALDVGSFVTARGQSAMVGELGADGTADRSTGRR